MSNLTVEFKFEVGEIVRPVIHDKVKLQVLTRTAEQCSGGVQIFYACQCENLYFTREQKILRLHEMELKKFDQGPGFADTREK
jgi:hypothetical protein